MSLTRVGWGNRNDLLNSCACELELKLLQPGESSDVSGIHFSFTSPTFPETPLSTLVALMSARFGW